MATAVCNRKIYRFGRFTLDLGRGSLRAGETDIPLRPKSFEVLSYLVEHHGVLTTKKEMLMAIWGHQYVSDDSLVQCIIDIRRALEDTQQTLVRNIPRRGYMLDVAVEVQPPGEPQRPPAETLEPLASRTPFSRASRIKRAGWILVGVALLLAAGIGVEKHLNLAASPAHISAAPGLKVRDHSIAVLPFLDLSPDQDQAWFAEGLSEEILNLLTQFHGLRVIARTSSFSFKNTNLDIPAIGSKLGVAYVLEGSVRKAGQDVRITTQLVSAGDGEHLWSQNYDRKLENVLELQSEVAAAVADTLEMKLIRKPSAGKVSPAAYEAFLQAEFFYNRRALGDLERARDYYLRAVKIDPNLGRAWTGLSGTDFLLLIRGLDRKKEFVKEQFQAAQKGLQLDPNRAAAHMRMAQSYYTREQNELADEQWHEAVALNANDPYILGVLAGWAAQQLNFEEAISLQQQAVASNPVSSVQRGNLAGYLFSGGRYEKALSEFRQAIDLNPSKLEESRPYMAQALVQLGRYQEALELANLLVQPAYRNLVQAMAMTRLGQRERAKSALQLLKSVESTQGMALLAQWYSWSGDTEHAFELMNRCIRRYSEDGADHKTWSILYELASSPLLSSLEEDPRWKRWVEEFLALDQWHVQATSDKRRQIPSNGKGKVSNSDRKTGSASV